MKGVLGIRGLPDDKAILTFRDELFVRPVVFIWVVLRELCRVPFHFALSQAGHSNSKDKFVNAARTDCRGGLVNSKACERAGHKLGCVLRIVHTEELYFSLSKAACPLEHLFRRMKFSCLSGWKPFEERLHRGRLHVLPRVADQRPLRAGVMPSVIERRPRERSRLTLTHTRGEEVSLCPALDELLLHWVRDEVYV